MRLRRKPGWYHVSGGALRWRDENGWTEHYLHYEGGPVSPWPPPPPSTSPDAEATEEQEPAERHTPGWKRFLGRN